MDAVKTFFAIFTALFKLFRIYPDVVFSKGGYPAVPVTIAAKILGIPLVVHDSDTFPGRANKLASRWAKRIAISFDETAQFFPKEKTAFVGHVVRKSMQQPLLEGAYEYLKLKPTLPVILILGGSQGARALNDSLINVLPKLVEKYQVVHQTGAKNFEEVKNIAQMMLKDNPNAENYKPFAYFNELAMRMLGGVTTIVVTRAGAASLGEIAYWKKPAIIIPITHSNGDHQRRNAYAYARTGGAVVIEESNLGGDIFLAEIERILESEELQNKMKEGVTKFQFPDAADKIAEEIIYLGQKHR